MDHKTAEENVRYMMILSSFLIAIMSILLDFANENGIFISKEVLLDFTIFPMLYILSYFILQIIKVKADLGHESKTYQIISYLTIFNFLVLGMLLFFLVSHDWWIRLEIFKQIIGIPIWLMLGSAIVIFVTSLYALFNSLKRKV